LGVFVVTRSTWDDLPAKDNLETERYFATELFIDEDWGRLDDLIAAEFPGSPLSWRRAWISKHLPNIKRYVRSMNDWVDGKKRIH